MKEKTSQTKEMLKHLQKHGTITSMQAIKKFGAIRLSAIIYALRKQGYSITTTIVLGKSRYGNTSLYALYTYIPKEGEQCRR